MSVDLSQTHLKTVHVIAIILALLAGAMFVGKTYIDVAWEVRGLKTKQDEMPTKKDIEAVKTSLSTDLTHAASDRVKFYMEHAKLECDPAARGHKQNCRLVWPVPDED